MLAPALAATSKASEYSSSLLVSQSWIITQLRHFEFLSISADHLRLLLQADHQEKSFFLFTKGSNRYFKHEGALYKEVFPGKTETHLELI